MRLLKTSLALKMINLEAAIFKEAPVEGFRPNLALLEIWINEPRPPILTASFLLTTWIILMMIESRARSALAFEISAPTEIASIICTLFIICNELFVRFI